jgi:hypothetical protein
MTHEFREAEEPQEARQLARPLEGRYANAFALGYNAFEFLLDFGQAYSHAEDVIFHTRIILAPSYARALLLLLQSNLEEYQRTFGPVREA